MYVQLFPGLFTTDAVLNNTKYSDDLDRKAPVLLNAAWMLSNKLQIKNPPNIFFEPIESNDGFYLWGNYNENNEIFINLAMDLYHNIKALAHEFIHAEQAQLGELIIKGKDYLTTQYTWKGKVYEFKCKDAERSDDGSYHAMPWEVEARDREIELTAWLLKNLDLS